MGNFAHLGGKVILFWWFPLMVVKCKGSVDRLGSTKNWESVCGRAKRHVAAPNDLGNLFGVTDLLINPHVSTQEPEP